MKIIHFKAFKTFLLLIIIIGSVEVMYSQDNTSLSKFLILVETDGNNIKLTGLDGCAFKELTFSYRPNQAISQYGMVSKKQTKNGDGEDFLFTVEKTSTGLNLIGIRGTAWKNLSFECTKGMCNQYINQNGLTNKKQD